MQDVAIGSALGGVGLPLAGRAVSRLDNALAGNRGVRGMGFTGEAAAEAATSAPTFYSALARAINNTGINRAPVEQWKNTIRNMPGVKAEEIEFTGLNEWLDLQTGPVSREDVANYVRNNGVRVEEVVKGGFNSEEAEAIQRELLPLIERRDRVIRDAEQGVNVQEIAENNGQGDLDSMLDDGDISRDTYRRVQDVWDFNNEIEGLEEELSTLGDGSGTKWSSYTLPGGENYQEVLLTLPARPGQSGYKPASSHWDEPNVLAHTRFKDREGPNEERVLALEEIQSDWHQAGRERGYNWLSKENARRQYKELGGSEGRAAAFDQVEDLIYKEWPTISQKIKGIEYEGQNLPNPGAVFVDLHGQRLASYSPELLDAFAKYNKFIELSDLSEGNNRVPNAPLKQTSSWTSLVLNRMIRKAADEGYDGVAWIPGDIQNGQRIAASDNRSDFYDKIVVNAANKIGKKYGARVEKMPGLAKDADGKPVDFYYLRITPELQKKAKTEGFPLFAAAPFAVGGVGAGAAMQDREPNAFAR
jgi:hypothetical protein